MNSQNITTQALCTCRDHSILVVLLQFSLDTWFPVDTPGALFIENFLFAYWLNFTVSSRIGK